MKAYIVDDKRGYADCALIVFAESRGKAIASAMGTDEFPKYDWDFTELRARREPALDGAYRGRWRMDWDNDEDRLALVRDCGYYCNDDAFDPDDCERCVAKEYCDRHQDYLDEEVEKDNEVYREEDPS